MSHESNFTKSVVAIIGILAANIGAGIDGERFALWPVKQDGSMYVSADLPATIYAWKCGTPDDGVFPMRLLPGSCRGAEASY